MGAVGGLDLGVKLGDLVAHQLGWKWYDSTSSGDDNRRRGAGSTTQKAFVYPRKEKTVF